jgi:hypothetical protein
LNIKPATYPSQKQIITGYAGSGKNLIQFHVWIICGYSAEKRAIHTFLPKLAILSTNNRKNFRVIHIYRVLSTGIGQLSTDFIHSLCG